MTARTYTVTKPRTMTQVYAEQREITITLPAAPFEIPATDRSETAPRGLPIKNPADWRKVDRVLRMAERIRR
jgi:hypothetical protein